ncbi:MAG TPA: class I tRNA ligase family protein, partial [Longimicrobium sp.]
LGGARDGAPAPPPDTADRGVMRKLHQTIAKVGEDVPRLSYNTAIAAMMEYMNVLRAADRLPHADEVRPLVRLGAPFAPHVAEELWERLGNAGSIFRTARWPEYDPARAVADTVEFVVQVNGKLRARMPMTRGITEDAARDAALADENVRKFIDGKQVRKTIFVPDRLLNLVVG